MINKEFVLKVLHNTLGYKIVVNPVVGEIIQLKPREAFLYAVLTAHGYLDSSEPEFRFFLKRDYYRIFNQAEEYNIQEGLLSISDSSFSCTPNINIIEKPYILEGNKYLLPIEYREYSEFITKLREIHEKLSISGYRANDFIIIPIRNKTSKVSEFESFFEFIISRYFSKFGFFSDTQIPFYYGIGTPDASIYKISELTKALSKYNVGYRGYSLIELMTITTFGLDKITIPNELFSWDNAVFEVKTLQSSAPQIKKYISKGIFHKAFEVIPFKNSGNYYSGLITFSVKGEMKILQENSDLKVNRNQKYKYNSWLDTYVKFYLLANLTTTNLEELSRDAKFSLDKDGLIGFLKKVSYDDLIGLILHYAKIR